MSTRVTSIDEVVDLLQDVVRRSTDTGSRVGYFAALYRQVTVEVARSIGRGEFDDGPRMSRFDAAFGNRYFAALGDWEGDTRPAASWCAAFHHADEGQGIVLQHLLLGINAHINLDLAVAAAEIAPGDAIYSLERDFFLINDILVDVLDRVQDALNEVSPLLRLLDVVGCRTDERILDFSVTRARAAAWECACVLAHASEEERGRIVDDLDDRTVWLAGVVTRPALVFRPATELIRLTERHEVPDVIERLDAALGRGL